MKVLAILLGLHLDQGQGIFSQQPLLLLGLVGLGTLVRDDRRGALALGLLYSSLLVPNAAHPNWYGGWSFVGRFHWSSFLLWLFPLAHLVRGMVATKTLKICFITLCVMEILLQCVLLRDWLFVPDFLYPTNHKSFWSFAFGYLPYFRANERWWVHVPNWIAISICCGLVYYGWSHRFSLVPRGCGFHAHGN